MTFIGLFCFLIFETLQSWFQACHLIGEQIGNFTVTLIVNSSRILPQEELAAAMLIQAKLEADGIEIITNSSG